jgi:uncharacterized membrane protein YfcA
MTVYDLPDNVTRMTHVVQWANGVSDGLLGISLLFAIFMISFITTLQKNEMDSSFTYAIIITTVIGVLFRILGIVDNFVLFILFCLTGLGVWITSREKSYY